MQYLSTRTPDHSVSLSTALQEGLAPDGGLYVPSHFPDLAPEAFADCETIESVAERLLRPFADDDPLADVLPSICEAMYGFPVPVHEVGRRTSVLELFHGPTAAFKDVGARFLADSLARLNEDADRPLTILVATSGDTGAAVAAAFWRKPNVEVIVLYPKGKVSARQEQQLTGWSDNVQTVAVNGVFDDCQQLVKAAFQHDAWQSRKRLSSANSINIGRLLPQMTYYAHASLQHWRAHGTRPTVVVPSGNLGNGLACLYARECGLPIGEVVFATNANRPVTHYLETGDYQAFETQQTLATAMDVGNPSNMERLRYHWPTAEALRDAITAERVTDDEIEEQIRRGPDEWDTVWDPHTATAVEVRERLDPNENRDWMLVATAHPAKFPEVVEPLVGHEIDIPDPLAEVMARSKSVPQISPSLDELGDIVFDTETPTSVS
ncbi:threonine synthase [Salinibacter sp. 10B]|uniref:threonine synthase n=1 Tax=Salinibacter sp. 10B TaxID=1923971 RepID=UPI000D275A0F|nr:threonine synthase [Salinibacter sp. 10B]PQJ34087.1 threonine synthase [Salinibacter sp. 10B]